MRPRRRCVKVNNVQALIECVANNYTLRSSQTEGVFSLGLSVSVLAGLGLQVRCLVVVFTEELQLIPGWQVEEESLLLPGLVMGNFAVFRASVADRLILRVALL